MRLVPPHLQMEYTLLVPYTSSRVRTVRLLRGLGSAVTGSATFGFSIRGGREHGTGFFVSEVCEETRAAGLRVGDQILRVNGYSVEHAIHQEVLKLIQDSNHLNLKVRSVGMIPVKDRRSDPLIWVPVNTDEDNSKPQSPSITTNTDSLEQPALIHSIDGVDSQHEIKHISIAARPKLDCSICKGPEWHPGIFIQSTKEGGLAREAGLRPGDQIIQCNGVNFEDISFTDAVNILKKDKNLNLVVRKGSGADLFPGESSGYNSSASSVNGDGSSSGHSPNGGGQIWNDDAKRLSIVREEVSDMAASSKIPSPEGRVTLDKNKDWDEIEIEWEMADKQQSLMKNEMNGQIVSFPSHFEPSDIRPIVNETDSIDEVSVKIQEVVAIVHRSEVDETEKSTCIKEESASTEIKSVLPEEPAAVEHHTAISETNSNPSVISQASPPSLSRALSLEIQKRAQKFGLVDDDSSDDLNRKIQDKEDVNVTRKDLLKEIGEEKRVQHSMLMEEFKKVHSKMFANSMTFEEEDSHPPPMEQLTRQRHSVDGSSQRNRRDSHKNVENQGEENTNESKIENNSVAVEAKTEENAEKVAPPPLPPPLPISPSNHSLSNGWTKREKESPMSPPSTVKKQLSYSRTSSSESLTPKSPKNPFFSNDSNIKIVANGKATEEIPRKQQQQQKGHVSVTISEYPSSNAARHVPTKMPVFEKTRPVWKKYVDPSTESKDNPAARRDFKQLASQVQSELQQTLSRAKLKEQAEAPTDDKKQNGSTLLPGNTAVSRYLSQVYGLEKEEVLSSPTTPHHNTDKILNALANKVTIRVPNSVSQAANKKGGN